MRIHQSGTEGSASKTQEGLERNRKRVEEGKAPPSHEMVQAFDLLLKNPSNKLAGNELDLEQPERIAVESKKKLPGFDGLQAEISPQVAAMLQAPMLQTQNSAQLQQSSQPQRAADVVELLRKHVRQLALSPELRASSQSAATGQVWLRLSDDLLPGTELLIEREGDGNWHIGARSDSRESLEFLERCLPDLQQRFADLALGEIRINTALLG